MAPKPMGQAAAAPPPGAVLKLGWLRRHAKRESGLVWCVLHDAAPRASPPQPSPQLLLYRASSSSSSSSSSGTAAAPVASYRIEGGKTTIACDEKLATLTVGGLTDAQSNRSTMVRFTALNAADALEWKAQGFLATKCREMAPEAAASFLTPPAVAPTGQQPAGPDEIEGSSSDEDAAPPPPMLGGGRTRQLTVSSLSKDTTVKKVIEDGRFDLALRAAEEAVLASLFSLASNTIAHQKVWATRPPSSTSTSLASSGSSSSNLMGNSISSSSSGAAASAEEQGAAATKVQAGFRGKKAREETSKAKAKKEHQKEEARKRAEIKAKASGEAKAKADVKAKAEAEAKAKAEQERAATKVQAGLRGKASRSKAAQAKAGAVEANGGHDFSKLGGVSISLEEGGGANGSRTLSFSYAFNSSSSSSSSNGNGKGGAAGKEEPPPLLSSRHNVEVSNVPLGPIKWTPRHSSAGRLEAVPTPDLMREKSKSVALPPKPVRRMSSTRDVVVVPQEEVAPSETGAPPPQPPAAAASAAASAASASAAGVAVPSSAAGSLPLGLKPLAKIVVECTMDARRIFHAGDPDGKAALARLIENAARLGRISADQLVGEIRIVPSANGSSGNGNGNGGSHNGNGVRGQQRVASCVYVLAASSPAENRLAERCIAAFESVDDDDAALSLFATTAADRECFGAVSQTSVRVTRKLSLQVDLSLVDAGGAVKGSNGQQQQARRISVRLSTNRGPPPTSTTTTAAAAPAAAAATAASADEAAKQRQQRERERAESKAKAEAARKSKEEEQRRREEDAAAMRAHARLAKAVPTPLLDKSGQLRIEWSFFGGVVGEGRAAEDALIGGAERLEKYQTAWAVERKRRQVVARQPVTTASRLRAGSIVMKLGEDGQLCPSFEFTTDNGNQVSVETAGQMRFLMPTPRLPLGAVPTLQQAYRQYARRNAYNQVVASAVRIQRAVRLVMARRTLAAFRKLNVVNLSISSYRNHDSSSSSSEQEAAPGGGAEPRYIDLRLTRTAHYPSAAPLLKKQATQYPSLTSLPPTVAFLKPAAPPTPTEYPGVSSKLRAAGYAVVALDRLGAAHHLTDGGSGSAVAPHCVHRRQHHLLFERML